MKRLALFSLLSLAACALPPPEQPAQYTRMGRFMGLVANCACTDITPERMQADYAKVVAGRYSEAEIAAMAGYVALGVGEKWQNLIQICAEICSQTCMVRAVTEPLGGHGADGPACLVSERDLHLTDGQQIDTGGGGFP